MKFAREFVELIVFYSQYTPDFKTFFRTSSYVSKNNWQGLQTDQLVGFRSKILLGGRR